MGGCFLFIAFMCVCIYFGGWGGLILGIGFTALVFWLES